MQASGFIDYDVCKQPQPLNGLVEGSIAVRTLVLATKFLDRQHLNFHVDADVWYAKNLTNSGGRL